MMTAITKTQDRLLQVILLLKLLRKPLTLQTNINKSHSEFVLMQLN